MGWAFATIKIYNRDPPRATTQSQPWPQGTPPLAHGDQKTRQLTVMQGQSGVMLVQALSKTRGGVQKKVRRFGKYGS